MTGAVSGLKDIPSFQEMFIMFKNPILGVIVGAILTAIIQSSSASVGILQALAATGAVSYGAAIPIIMGQNIGTCITAIISSIGVNSSARKVAVVHLSFNIIGTAIFTTLCLITPVVSFVETLTPANPASQIANMHTIFNIVTTLILIPFGGQLAKLAVKILPEIKAEDTDEPHLKFINVNDHTPDGNIGNSAIAISNIGKELSRMADMVRQNVDLSFLTALKVDEESIKTIDKNEEYIDYLKSYTYDGICLGYTDETGVYDMKAEEFYEAESGVMIYYVPADMEEDTTETLIPKDCVYTVSGNNVDGFIITCSK